MKKTGRIMVWSLAALVAGLLVSASVARAESADDIFKAVKSKVDGIKDYSLKYDYHGPKGEYKFDYRCVRPSDIRTAIVAGRNQGAILLFKPSDKADKVKAKKGMFSVWKDVTDDDIKGTPIIESVLDMAVKQVGTPKAIKGDEKVGGHDCYVLTFSTGAELAVDKASHDILRWKQPEADGKVAERDFYDIEINKGVDIKI